jgi:aerobic-type carbon monoxide dehydrogenase small subunit (CoxS/CutS family)
MPRVTDLTINGKKRRIDADPDRSLLSVLREDLGLTGTKYGCGEAQCGACTVLVDGFATRSCTLPVKLIGKRSITTIEGLERDGRLHPVQQAFIDADAMQCGYCTPGMIMSVVGLLQIEANPSNALLKQKLNGNMCRCGTYPRIVQAVRLASRTVTSEGNGGKHA